MMPHLPEEEALLEKVMAAFVEKAVFSQVELILVWEQEADIQTYFRRWMYGYPLKVGRVLHVLRNRLDAAKIMETVDAYIIGRNPEELPLLDAAFRRGLPIFGPQDDGFQDMELLPEETAQQSSCEQILQGLLARFPEETHEILLVHQGLGECSVLFSWLHAYRETIGKKCLLVCYQKSRAALFSKCPDADAVALVSPALYTYMATRRRDGHPWKNFLAVHFLPLEGRTKAWTFLEEIPQFLGLSESLPMPIVTPKSFGEEARTAERTARDLGLSRGQSVLLFPDGYNFAGFYAAHPEFWQELVESLAKRGMTAVVNGNVQIPGAKNVFLPLWETIALASWCGHIVSISTGMAEICCTFATAEHLSVTMVWPNARDPYLYEDVMRWKWRMEMMQDYGMKFMEQTIKDMHRYEDRLWKKNVDASDLVLSTDALENKTIAATIAERVMERSKEWN